MKRICSPSNFSPALCLRRDSPWMEDLSEREKKIQFLFKPEKSASPGLHNSLAQALERTDKVLFPYQSCLFCQTICTPDVQPLGWRAAGA